MTRADDDLCVQRLTVIASGDEHVHHHHELVLVDSGDYRVEVGGRILHGQPGSSFLFPAHTAHRPRSDAAICLMVLQWTGLDALVASLPLVGKDGSGRLAIASQWLWEWTRAGTCPIEDRLALLRVCLRHHAPASLGGLPDDAVSRAMAILSEGSGPGLQLPHVARVLGLSTAQLVRRFRAATGQTPMAYRRQCRIDRAMEWLREGRLSITEVAERCGFASAAHLSNTLLRERGQRPGRLRSR